MEGKRKRNTENVRQSSIFFHRVHRLSCFPYLHPPWQHWRSEEGLILLRSKIVIIAPIVLGFTKRASFQISIFQKVDATHIKTWSSFSLSRFLGQHQQMFKLFEKVFLFQSSHISFCEEIKTWSYIRPREHCGENPQKSLAGFWWGVLGKLHHWRITQVWITTASQNIIWPKLSPAATLETKRTLTSGWNDWLQGFLEPMRKIPQKWGFLQQKKPLNSFKYLHRSSVIRNRWKTTPWKNCTGFAGVSSAHHTSYINLILRGKLRLHQGVPKVVINSSNEDLSLSIADEMPPR